MVLFCQLQFTQNPSNVCHEPTVSHHQHEARVLEERVESGMKLAHSTSTRGSRKLLQRPEQRPGRRHGVVSLELGAQPRERSVECDVDGIR